MPAAYICDAVRTPMGRRNGGLADVHPADLGAAVLSRLVQRGGFDPAVVDDVIFGCISQIGAQAFNVARTAWLSAGLPESVPAVTIDRQCGSSQQALHFAAQGILAGSYDVAIAGGVESMSTVPLNCSGEWGPELGVRYPFDGQGWTQRYGPERVHQFASGERIAEKWGIAREEMERYSLASHAKAQAAWEAGHFDREVFAVNGLERDETIRVGSTPEKMATLKPISEGGVITAGTASQIADAATGVLLASEDAVEHYGLTPRARVHTMAVAGSDPWLMLTGPIPATEKALSRAGLTVDDIDLYECNEAFAVVVLAWAREVGVDPDRVNVNGGAVALGHALGATGTRLMTTLLHELERRGARYGLQTVCEGGGQANATIIERV